MRLGLLLLRKIAATFAATVVVSIVMGALYVLSPYRTENLYNLGHQFMGWTIIYFMYVGVIILVYGNAVSLGLEWIRSQGWIQHPLILIALHGVFGSALGLVFPSIGAVIYGIVAATIYGVIDYWFGVRISRRKGIIHILLIPVVVYVGFGLVLQWKSPPVPYFTMEDAVEFATSGKGTVIDAFPDRIGVWEGHVGGYEVRRETSASEVAPEKYVVTFTETWQKGPESGSCYYSYRVERGTLTALSSGGVPFPYRYK